MAAVGKRTPSSSRLKSTPSSSTTTTTATTTANNNPRRPATRALEAAAAATSTNAMSLTIEVSASAQDGRMLTPPPMSAQSDLARRLGDVSVNSPVSAAASHNTAANSANANANANATSLFAQNRAMLLSGLAKGDAPPATQGIQRRDSGNGSLVGNRRLTPLVTAAASAPGSSASPHARRHPYPLSAHPHLGSVGSPVAQSPRTISPCVYVKAVGLRRPSAVSVDANEAKTHAEADRTPKKEIREKREKKEKKDADKEKPSSASSITSDSLLSTPPPESRLVVAARITPANTDRPPFTLQREFDLQALVDALPRPDHRRPSTVNILASPTVHAPPMPFASPTAGKKRPAADDVPASPHPSLRRHTRQSSQQQQQPPTKELPSPSLFAANGRIPIPIRPHPSLGRLPGLAAIILSRRVEAGDTIEIPMPFPDAWPMTVSYVYKSTGEAEATSEIRANLEHLGGTVTDCRV